MTGKYEPEYNRYVALGNRRAISKLRSLVVVREPKSHIVQKHIFFAPERYTAQTLYTDSLNSA